MDFIDYAVLLFISFAAIGLILWILARSDF